MDWAENDVRSVIDGLLSHSFRDGRIGLRVRGNVADFATENPSGRVDFLDCKLDAIIEVVARCRAGSGQLHDPVEEHRTLLRDGDYRDARENGQNQQLNLLHDYSSY